jgi:hypothetical protein
MSPYHRYLPIKSLQNGFNVIFLQRGQAVLKDQAVQDWSDGNVCGQPNVALL